MMISAHDMIPFGQVLRIRGNVWDAWAREFGADKDVPISVVVERVMSKVGLRAAWFVAWELQSKERRRAALRQMFERLAAIGGPTAELATRAAQAEVAGTAFDWAELSVDARQVARQMVGDNDRKVAIVWAVEAACHDPALVTARAGITAFKSLPGVGQGDGEMTRQLLDLIRT
jgi:hypothetical protein